MAAGSDCERRDPRQPVNRRAGCFDRDRPTPLGDSPLPRRPSSSRGGRFSASSSRRTQRPSGRAGGARRINAIACSYEPPVLRRVRRASLSRHPPYRSATRRLCRRPPYRSVARGCVGARPTDRRAASGPTCVAGSAPAVQIGVLRRVRRVSLGRHPLYKSACYGSATCGGADVLRQVPPGRNGCAWGRHSRYC
jgi:hypothetical protein